MCFILGFNRCFNYPPFSIATFIPYSYILFHKFIFFQFRIISVWCGWQFFSSRIFFFSQANCSSQYRNNRKFSKKNFCPSVPRNMQMSFGLWPKQMRLFSLSYNLEFICHWMVTFLMLEKCAFGGGGVRDVSIRVVYVECSQALFCRNSIPLYKCAFNNYKLLHISPAQWCDLDLVSGDPNGSI